MIDTELTEEQAEARLHVDRARKALSVASAAVSHLRSMIDAGGRTERGVEVPEAKTPLMSAMTDQADETYAVLLEWVGYFAAEFGEPSPAGDAPIAWRMFQASHRSEGYADAPIAGFKPGTTAHQARTLVSTLTGWLTGHLPRVEHHTALEAFEEEISDTIWSAHGLARMSARTAREASPRPCPNCGAVAVVADYYRQPLAAADRRREFDGIWNATEADRRNPRSVAGQTIEKAVDGVGVRCQMCGWTETPTPALIVRWLEGAEPLKSTRQWQDPDAEFWTITQAALHFGFTRQTIEKYIRGGLPVYLEGTAVRPHEAIDEWKTRMQKRAKSRGQ